MRIGVVFPQTEIGDDPAKVRDFAQAAEALGFDHLIAYDHVLGADPNRPGGWTGAYTSESAFYEPFALFAYLGAITHRLELVSGVFVLPQRQTALFAKQAATVDLLCGGRLRLGIGLGWNAVEFEALGEDFHNRGARIVEVRGGMHAATRYPRRPGSSSGRVRQPYPGRARLPRQRFRRVLPFVRPGWGTRRPRRLRGTL